MKAQLADTQTALRPDRRPEDATGHRTGRVKVAHASLRIEHRARLTFSKIGKFIEPALCALTFVEDSRNRVPGKPAGDFLCQPRNGLPRTLANSGRALGITLLQLSQSLTQTRGIELGDGKRPHAALRASRPTEQ